MVVHHLFFYKVCQATRAAHRLALSDDPRASDAFDASGTGRSGGADDRLHDFLDTTDVQASGLRPRKSATLALFDSCGPDSMPFRLRFRPNFWSFYEGHI